MLYDHVILLKTIEAWQCALNIKDTPTILVLTRQDLPLIRKKASNKNLVKLGAYPIIDYDKYDATIIFFRI